jgi:hypothetical protein
MKKRVDMGRCIAAVAMALSAALTGAPTLAAQTVPHEAHYVVTLGELKIPGEVRSSDGDMAVRVTRDCQKWTVQQETYFKVWLKDGGEIDIRNRYRIHEALDGSRLEFYALTTVNGRVAINTKGIATMSDDGGTVSFSKPEERKIALPAGTGFPIAVANMSLEMLISGKTISRYLMFDGTGVYHVTDVVAGKPTPLRVTPEGDIELLDSRVWLVESALYPYGSVDSEPAGTVVTQTQENGIATRFEVDYGMVTARGVLSSIRRLDDFDC